MDNRQLLSRVLSTLTVLLTLLKIGHSPHLLLAARIAITVLAIPLLVIAFGVVHYVLWGWWLSPMICAGVASGDLEEEDRPGGLARPFS